MIDKKLVSDFADIIGNISILLNFEVFQDVKKEYEMVLDELILWLKNYYKTKNFDIVTIEKSLEIHEILNEIKWNKITDATIGDESLLTDNILIRYEVIIKTINNERGNF